MTRKGYDSTDPNGPPGGGDFYFGYGNGLWRTYSNFKQLYPDKVVLEINVDGNPSLGTILDVEGGDASPATVPSWLTARRNAGVKYPWVYCSRSTWSQVQAQCEDRGIEQPLYWIADPTGVEHLIPGTVATQWLWSGSPRYDESMVSDNIPGIDSESGDTVTDQDKLDIVNGVHTLLDEFYNNQYKPVLDDIERRLAAIEAKIGV